MPLRSLSLHTQPGGQIVHPETIIGVDESGNCRGDDAFCIAAVVCPREAEVDLAETFIEAGLDPWKEKFTPAEFFNADIIEWLSAHDRIDWYAAGASGSFGVDEKAALAVKVAKYTLVQPSVDVEHPQTEVALIHDGGDDLYGRDQVDLRRQATPVFDTQFQSNFGPIRLTQSPNADLTYPSVMAADGISGVLREAIQAGEPLGELYDRFEWAEPGLSRSHSGSVADLYYLRDQERAYDEYLWENVSAWLFGRRHHAAGDHHSSPPVDRLIERVESDVVTTYLQEFEAN